MVNSKYTECVYIEFDDFPDSLRNINDYRDLLTPVGKFGILCYCYLVAEIKLDQADGKEYFVFGIVFLETQGEDKIEVRYKCFIKNHNKSNVQCEEVKEIISTQFYRSYNYKYTENKYDMNEILDEKNGFLKNEKLTIRIEISVDAVIRTNGIREWGFPSLETDKKQWIAVSSRCANDSTKVYANRQIIEFHAPSLPKNEPDYKPAIDQLLQMMHGVQPFSEYHSYSDMFAIIPLASDYQIHNVFRICEQHIISKYRLSYHRSGYWKDAFHHNLKSFLKLLLENVKSSKELKEILEYVKWEESSAEIMKHLVAKFLSFC